MSGVNEPEVEEDPIPVGNDGVQPWVDGNGRWGVILHLRTPEGTVPFILGGEEGQQMIGEMAVGLATAQLTAVSERVKSETPA